MSHGRSRHPRLLRSRSAGCGRWLWRLVRRKLTVKRPDRAKAVTTGRKSKQSYLAHAEVRLDYSNRTQASPHSRVSPPPDSNFKTPGLGKRDTLPDRITLGRRIQQSLVTINPHIPRAIASKFLRRTSQMSHAYARHAACASRTRDGNEINVSTRRDEHTRWLWRLVRLFLHVTARHPQPSPRPRNSRAIASSFDSVDVTSA